MEKKEAVQEKKPAKELSLINSYCIHKTMGYNRKRIINKKKSFENYEYKSQVIF